MKINNLDKIKRLKEKYLNREVLLKNKLFILKFLIIFLIFILFLVSLFESDNEEILETLKEETPQAEEEKSYIIVDVSGAVINPTVVELPKDARVEDAITAAGGLREDADISSINRAEILSDGSKVFIPSKDDSTLGTAPTYESNSNNSAKINLNSATSEELRTIIGIGPATAEKIIMYRKENGRFNKIEDIKNVNGIGDKIFEKIKDKISV